MSLVFQIIVSAFLCLILFALVWMAKSKVFLPIKGGEDVRISTVVFARGRAESLQQVIDGLSFIKSTGKAQMDVIIADSGLDGEAQKMTEILIKNSEEIKLCRAEELCALLGDEEWMKAERPYK